MPNITTPKEFYGFQPGTDREMLRWDKIVAYFKEVSKQTDRMILENMGPTTLNNPFLKLTISSPENLAKLDEYKTISKKLADPRTLSEEEIDALVKTGKAVCVQTYSMHAMEVGGTQMVSLLVYDLLSRDDAAIQEVLDNVIFICVPSLNPDGNIMVADWYYKNKGTEYEGCRCPELFHHYSGHDNSYDGLASKLVESRYMDRILFREWFPQCYLDIHQYRGLCSRTYLSPLKDPIMKNIDPITMREKQFYGGALALDLEFKGFKGVITGARWTEGGFSGLHSTADAHNIPVMLCESAMVKIATPRYEDPTLISGDDDDNSPGNYPIVKRPNPWKGGWWHLSDIVERQFNVALGLLQIMARNREMVLRNMAVKALNQTQRGAEAENKAYIIPAIQHDHTQFMRLAEVLSNSNIEYYAAEDEIKVGSAVFPKGSLVVPAAQPAYAYVENALGHHGSPDNVFTRGKDGVLKIVAYRNLADLFGVECIPAAEMPLGVLNRCNYAMMEAVVAEANCYRLKGSDNGAYLVVNRLLKENCEVFRDAESKTKDFYVRCTKGQFAQAVENVNCRIEVSAVVPEKLLKVEKLKVGVYQRYFGGNANEGWIRLALDDYEFDYESVHVEDILKGKLSELDVLVLPGDNMTTFLGEKLSKGDAAYARSVYKVGKMPPEYIRCLDPEGSAKIKEFVQNGGQVVCTSTCSDYAIAFLDISVANVLKGKKAKEFSTGFSTAYVNFDTENPVCYGMPSKGIVMLCDGPAFKLDDRYGGFYTGNASICGRYEEEEKLLCSGRIVGEKFLAEQGAIAVAGSGKGKVTVFGFEPTQHGCTEGTFKLLFNTLYQQH